MSDDVNRENVEDENVKNDGGVRGDQVQPKMSLAEFLAEHKPKKSAARVVQHMDEIKALRHQGYSLEQIKMVLNKVRGVDITLTNLQQILFRSSGPAPKSEDVAGATEGGDGGEVKPKARAPRRTRKSFDVADVERELQEIERWREIKARSANLISEILNEAPPTKKAGAAGTASGTSGAGVSGAAVAAPPRNQDLGREVSGRTSGIAKDARPAVNNSAEDAAPRRVRTGNPVQDARNEADEELLQFKLDKMNSGGVFANRQKYSQS